MSDIQSSTITIKGRGYRVQNAAYPAALWTYQNPILQRGEIGVESDTLLFKVGDGINRWNDLEYSTGPQGPQGETGPYYTPSVDAAGNLSWTNNGDLPNPQTVNIKGPQGIQGEQGEQGVQGETGLTGPTGPTGPYFTPFVNATTGDISWTNNGGLENPTTVNIKGPQGEQGIQGIQGPQGLVITNIVVTDVTGVISVTTSASINSAPTCKFLIGGSDVSGTWTGSGTSWTFTPTEPSDVLTEAWIVTLPAA